jgi:hypothetical protein
MPRYSLRLGNTEIPLASTRESISSRLLDRGRPNTITDAGGTVDSYSFGQQDLNRNELR